MKITGIKVYPYKAKKGKSSSLKGFAAVEFDECFVVKVSIMDGKKGLFVSMPQQKGSDGEYYDQAYPITKELREKISDKVIDAYNEEVDGSDDDEPKKKKKKKSKDEDEDDDDDEPPF